MADRVSTPARASGPVPRSRLVSRFWGMREQTRVVIFAVVLALLLVVTVTVATNRIATIERSTDEVAEELLPARDQLFVVRDGLQTTRAMFVDILGQPDELDRLLMVEQTRRQLSRTESAWRDYQDLSVGLECEEGAAAEFDAAKSEQDELSGPVGLGLISGGDVGELLQSEELAQMQGAMATQIAVVDRLLDECYTPAIEADVAASVGAVDDARREVLIFAGVAFLLGSILVGLGLRTVRQHEAERDAHEDERALQERRNELEASLQRALSMTRSEEEAFGTVRDALRLGNPTAPTELLVADSSEAHFRQVLSTDGGEGPGCPVVSPTECPAVQGGETRIFWSSTALDACPHLRDRQDGPCSAVCVPVSIAGRSVGVLHTTAPDEAPPPEEAIGNVELIGARAGDRIGLLRAMAESETQARSDPLTGLLNRRSLENAVNKLVQEGTPYVVAFGDLDHFKRLNDSHGHDAGDRALRLFTRALRDSVRPNDLVCRYGGEEFLVVLPDCTPGSAADIVERIRERLDHALSAGTTPGFTVSFGLAASTQADGFDQVVGLADHAMLAAKASGRDRVLIAGEPDDVDTPVDGRGDLAD